MDTNDAINMSGTSSHAAARTHQAVTHAWYPCTVAGATALPPQASPRPHQHRSTRPLPTRVGPVRGRGRVPPQCRAAGTPPATAVHTAATSHLA